MEDDIKKIMLVLVVVAVIVIVGMFGWAISTHNKMVTEEEAIDSAWAQVSNEYQRKIDLIPALIDNVSGYQEFESSTLTEIVELRSQWMNAATTEDQVNATNALDSALKSIILTYESYPYLASVNLVSSVMYTLEGTENRITVARMDYNNKVEDYNAHIKKFPASALTSWGDFEERSYYVSPEAPEAP